MSWKSDFFFLLLCVSVPVASCQKDKTTRNFSDKKNDVRIFKRLCGLELAEPYNVSFRLVDDEITTTVQGCTGSFILGNRASTKPKKCSIKISGPCVSEQNIFSRYGIKDADRFKKKSLGEHLVSISYHVPGRSYGVISIEPAVEIHSDPYSFSQDSLKFDLSHIAILRKKNHIPLLRSLAPDGLIKIVNHADTSRRFKFILENYSDALSSMEHVNVITFSSKKKGKLSYLLEGTLPAKQSALIKILPRKIYRPWSFAFGGDVKDEIGIFLQLLEQLLLTHSPLFIIEAGDYTRNSLPRELHNYFERTKWLPIPVYFVKGNHEIRVQGEKHYSRMFGPSRYSFSFDDVLFVILDSTDYGTNGSETGFRLGNDQLSWLETVLKSNRSVKYSFVSLHTPPVPLHGPSLRPSYPSNMISSEATSLMDLSKKYSVTYVLSGHAHLYARKEINGTVYLTSGAGGAKLHTYNKVDGFDLDTKKHLMVFEITNSGIREERVFLPRDKLQSE